APGGQRRQAQSVVGVVRIHDCVLTIPFFGFYGCLRLCPLEEVSEVDSTANTAVREELLGGVSERGRVGAGKTHTNLN
ncbi:hypothetical protein CgS9114_15223, partial [Corynebacterium glutamicum S9114]